MGAGQICAVIANCSRDPKRKPRPWTASDFFPILGGAETQAAPATNGGIDDLLSMAVSMGATIVDENGVPIDEAPYAVRA